MKCWQQRRIITDVWPWSTSSTVPFIIQSENIHLDADEFWWSSTVVGNFWLEYRAIYCIGTFRLSFPLGRGKVFWISQTGVAMNTWRAGEYLKENLRKNENSGVVAFSALRI